MPGVWEGNVTSDVGGLVKPAERVRIELTDDGHYIGKCLVPDEHSSFGSCSAVSGVPDGPAADRTWKIDRLTAGFEGMGQIDARSMVPVLLHRVRLTADGQSLSFTTLGREDESIVFHYWLKRVPK